MGSNYDCFRLRKDYRRISCIQCDKRPPHNPPPPACPTCEEKFAVDIARAIGGLLQCMACASARRPECGICVKVLDECTRVPLMNIEVTLIHNGMRLCSALTCPKGTVRFENLCDGIYGIACAGLADIETVELGRRCPYVMLVVAVPAARRPQAFISQ